MTPAPREDTGGRLGLPEVWRATADEVESPFPCDEHVPDPDASWFRAVTVQADPDTVFRWLCQLKVAPYSYDLVDNLGRASPRALTPGAERLQLGQRVMTIFELVSFDHGDHLTIAMRDRWALRVFGELALTYTVRGGAPPGFCRLVVKVVVRDPPGRWGGLRTRALAWGDLAMMRQQLLTLRELAEGTATRRTSEGP